MSGDCQRSRIWSVNTLAHVSAIAADMAASRARSICGRSCKSILPFVIGITRTTRAGFHLLRRIISDSAMIVSQSNTADQPADALQSAQAGSMTTRRMRNLFDRLHLQFTGARAHKAERHIGGLPVKTGDKSHIAIRNVLVLAVIQRTDRVGNFIAQAVGGGQ